jgi:hypothetical protein
MCGGTAIVNAPAGPVFSIDRSKQVVLRRMTISGTNRGVFVHAQSEVTLDGVVVDGFLNGLAIFEESSVMTGGPSAAQAVTIRNGVTGVFVDNSGFGSNGLLTIENNNGPGISAQGARVVLAGNASSPNAIRNNNGHGIFATMGSRIGITGPTTLSGNQLNAVLAFEGSVAEFFGTTMENNVRGGAAAIFNSSMRFTNTIVRNNGTDGDPLSSGVTSAENSSVLIGSTQITGTLGPGVLAEAGGMVRLGTVTISGGTTYPVRLRSGALAEIQAGNAVTGTTHQLIHCDNTGLLFGDNAKDLASNCKRAEDDEK